MKKWNEFFEKCGVVLVGESCKFCMFLDEIEADYVINTNGCIYIVSSGLRVSFLKEDNGKAYVRDFGICKLWDVEELKAFVIERDENKNSH